MKFSFWYIYWLIVILVFIFGCTTTPNSYGQYVEITSGLYKGSRGKLIGDCSGFERYRVKLNEGKNVCVHSWEMEKL